MRVRWTVPAADDLEGIKNYLERHYPLPYIIVYRVKDEVIEILHIYHGAQGWRRVEDEPPPEAAI